MKVAAIRRSALRRLRRAGSVLSIVKRDSLLVNPGLEKYFNFETRTRGFCSQVRANDDKRMTTSCKLFADRLGSDNGGAS